MRACLVISAFVFTLLVSSWGLSAQQDGARVSISPRLTRRASLNSGRPGGIRLDVDLVLVPVLVTDPLERPVLGLKKENFRLFEDGVEQPISQFFRQESAISVGIVFDASTSMHRKMDAARQAITKFLNLCLPDDEFFLLKFADHPEPIRAFTRNVSEIAEGVEKIQPGGWTALLDAIYLGMHHMKRAVHQGKVLLVVSDGGDNNSRYSESEIREMVREGDVRIFAISILDRSTLLEKLAEDSGGRYHRVRKLEELADLAETVSEELHSEYVLGYSPAERPRDGRYRRVKVDLVQPTGAPPLRTSWRRGYYGPGE